MEMGSKSLQGSTDSFNGINLGKKICLENGSSSKVMNPLKNPPRCQVEGCSVDLSGVKAYYGKHKVCGMHSKSPTVTVGGLEQRFCQQCSRFHQLPEFDQVKRSCRRRLAGHNERRRKPHSASLSSRTNLPSSPYHVDNRSSSLRGFLMNFTYPQLSVRDLSIMKQRRGSTNFSVPEGPIFDSSSALSFLSDQDQDQALIAAATDSSCFSPNRSFRSWGFDATKVLDPMWMQNELALDLRREKQHIKLDDDGNESLL